MNHLTEDIEQGKLKKICDVIRVETLEPARVEAESIIESAKAEAAALVAEGKVSAADLLAKARADIEKERKLFESSRLMAAKQTLTELRQQIEEQLFDENLATWLQEALSDPKQIARLSDVLIAALEKEGAEANFDLTVGKNIDAEKFNQHLAARSRKALEKGIQIGSFQAGVQLRLRDKKIVLDLSDDALVELLVKYLREDFRKHFFGLK